jgi:hypothetical protein
MFFEIKHKITSELKFSIEATSWKLAIKAALEAKADLSYADLSSANLSYADLHSANLSYADLSSANLNYANLSSANLSYANLSYANLRYANLRYANLSSANLRSADLRSADLSYAKYKEPLFLPDLYSLKLLPQDTTLTFWKYLKDGKSPYQHVEYEVGKEYRFDDANSDEKELCAKGGNVATLIWCLKDSLEADEFLEVEFKVKDICAIPYGTDGKFRVKRFKVLRKITRKQALAILKKAMG